MKRRHTLLTLLIAAHGHAADAPGEPFTLQLEERISHDSNLFRLPHTQAADAALQHYRAQRSDTLNRAGMAASARAGLGQQGFSLDAHAYDNRYQHNNPLDHTSGDAEARWQWQLSSALSGRLGHRYQRELTGFDNTRVLVKDLIDSDNSYLGAEWALGSQWQLLGELNQRDTRHSDRLQSGSDNTLNGQRAGLRYTSTAGNSFGLEQRDNSTRYDRDTANQDYDDRWQTLTTQYQLSGKTRLEAQAGRQSRNYHNTSNGDFDGNTGRATLRWQASLKTRLELAAFRELQSYVEQDADYFVSQGQRLSLGWQPRQKFTLNVAYQQADHDYQRQGPALFNTPLREDRVRSTELGARYTPWPQLELGLQLKQEQRDANQAENDFDADIVSAWINWDI